MNHCIGAVERAAILRQPADDTLGHPIFILGAPRCGSTLFYQCFVEYYDVGYFANIHHQFYLAPALVERLTHATRRPRSEAFRSLDGNAPGWTAPSENGLFWYRFFRKEPQYVTLEDVEPERLHQLRKAMGAFVSACGRPVVNKNLPVAVRLGPINHALPESVFIVVHRRIRDIAKSLLAGRMRKYGTYDRWWSVQPPDVGDLRNLLPHQQVVEQARSIYRLIDDEKLRLGPERFLDVDYNEFCEDTGAAFRAVDRFLDRSGIKLARGQKVPPSFPPSSGSDISPEVARAVDDYCSEIEQGERARA